MQVILLQDVPKIGKKNQVKDLSSGYVKNFLLPRGLAVLATKQATHDLDIRQRKEELKRAKLVENLEDIKKKITGLSLEFTQKVSEKGHLFGSIGAKDIITAIQKKAGLKLDKKAVEMEPLKTPGEHEVKIVLAEDVVIPVKVVVKEEGS